MDHRLIIYRSSPFDGCIYVKLKSRADIASAKIQLEKDGVVVATQVVLKKFARFKDNEPGVYRAIAELSLTASTSLTIESAQISVEEVAVASMVLPFVPGVKQKGNHTFYDNIKRYDLELKLEKNGLQKLDQESPVVVGRYAAQKSNMQLFKIDLKAFWQDESDEEDCDRYLIRWDVAKEELLALAQELEQLEYVIYCALVPDMKNMAPPKLPTELEQRQVDPDAGDTPVAGTDTPNFHHLQGYLEESGFGMNVRPAWEQAGETGSHATVRLMDAGVWPNHENLQGNITVVNSRPETELNNHGTASTGCIAAANRSFGVRGVAHDCDFYFYEAGDINEVLRDSQPGDLVACTIGFSVNGVLLPMIHDQFWRERIRALSNNGVTMLLSAANSGVDLNAHASMEIANREDTGSMLVGAIDPATGLRAWFSNYGHATSLISSWGLNVATTGYGTIFFQGNNRSYTATYNGTSAAAPLSAGALALIQSANIKHGVMLNPSSLRSMIALTGFPQEGQRIGHRPNVFRAIDEIAGFPKVLNTQDELTRAGNDANGSWLAELLSTYREVHIYAGDTAWTAQIVLPAANLIPQGANIRIFMTAQRRISLVVNNHGFVVHNGDAVGFVQDNGRWSRSSGLLLNTQADMDNLGADNDGRWLAELLRTIFNIEIAARDGVWTRRIIFPSAANIAEGRDIFFNSQADWAMTLGVNGKHLVLTKGSAARFVVSNGQWLKLEPQLVGGDVDVQES